MEDAKLQALHDTLSQIRGKQGLGTNSHFSWERRSSDSDAAHHHQRHPAAAHLPNNVLYANFLPEGVYDPKTKQGAHTGKNAKHKFLDDDLDDKITNIDKQHDKTQSKMVEGSDKKSSKKLEKELKKAKRKATKKAEKLKAKIEAKKLQKKLEKKLAKQHSLMLQKSSATEVPSKNDEDKCKTTISNNQNELNIDDSKLVKKLKKTKQQSESFDNVAVTKRTTLATIDSKTKLTNSCDKKKRKLNGKEAISIDNTTAGVETKKVSKKLKKSKSLN